MAWRTHLHSEALLHLKGGKATVRGVLLRQDRRTLTLARAQYLEAGRDPVPVDGVVIVERTNVDFAQILHPGSS